MEGKVDAVEVTVQQQGLTGVERETFQKVAKTSVLAVLHIVLHLSQFLSHSTSNDLVVLGS